MWEEQEINAHYGCKSSDRWQKKHLEKPLHASNSSCNGARKECAAEGLQECGDVISDFTPLHSKQASRHGITCEGNQDTSSNHSTVENTTR